MKKDKIMGKSMEITLQSVVFKDKVCSLKELYYEKKEMRFRKKIRLL